MPSCISSEKFGIDGFTTSLHASLCEIDAFSGKSIAHQPMMMFQLWNILLNLLGNLTRIWLLHTSKLLLKSLKRPMSIKLLAWMELKLHSLSKLPRPALYFLACIFCKSITKHLTPEAEAWLHCKMTCIPKKQGKTSVKDLRPLTIAPVIYRVFCKTILHIHQEPQQQVPADSTGGRSARQAWLPAALQCEASWKALPQFRKCIQGAAIETEQFFDNVAQDAACEALVDLGMDPDATATWQHMLKNIRRYASLNGAIIRKHSLSIVGIPQGDPLSMVAAATLLGKWTLELPDNNLFANVFVDDRLLLSHDNVAQLHAFHTTEFWDSQFQFRTQAKTVAFGNNKPQDDLWWTDVLQAFAVHECEMLQVHHTKLSNPHRL